MKFLMFVLYIILYMYVYLGLEKEVGDNIWCIGKSYVFLFVISF